MKEFKYCGYDPEGIQCKTGRDPRKTGSRLPV